jgi:hypothetical protein|tara:strand:- start:6137 stop:6715 length:579 start_codon:yes stop_codon:yes gene_type:complete
MKVFGLGMFKTGTTTLEQCLRLLDMKHVDLDTDYVYFNGDAQGYLRRNVEDIVVDYDYDNFTTEELAIMQRVTENYEGFSDHPWMWTFKECYKMYPDAKFVLTVRKDSETLANSDRNFFLMHGATEEDLPDASEFIHRYETHNAAVREFFKDKDNYIELCWETGDGWKELCDFLGVEVPNIPFPHANKGVYK